MKKVASNIPDKTKKESSPLDRLILIFFGLWAVFFAEAFLYWTLVPFFQMRTYLDNLTHGRVWKIVKTDFIFSPYSYAQRVIRYEFLKYVEGQEMDVQNLPVLDKAIQEMEEMVEMEGSDPYQHIRLGRAFEKKVALLKDPSYFRNAEEYYKKAMALAPQRQELYYAYGLSLVRQSRAEEAVAILKAPPALDPDIPLSYYYLGLAQFNDGTRSYPDALVNMELFFERSSDNPDTRISQALYQRFFHHFYRERDATHLVMAAGRLIQLDPDRQNLYQQVVAFMKQTNQFPRLDFKEGLIQALL